MKPKKLGILDPAPFLAVVGVLVATASVSKFDPQSLLAVPLMGLLGVFLTRVIAERHRDPSVAEFLGNLMLLGIAVRLLILALLYQSVGPYVFAPDQWTYESWGDAVLTSMVDGTPLPAKLASTVQLAYPTMNAVLYFFFGKARAAPSMLNILLSAWTAIPVYHLTLEVVRKNAAVARWAAGLTVLFPSLMLWSVLNIREAPTILTMVLVVYFFVLLQKRANVESAAALVIFLAILTLFREYLTGLVVMGGAAGILMGRSRSPVRSLIVGSVMLVALTFAFQSFGGGSSLAGEPTLERAQFLREAFTTGAGSAYGQGADVSTTGGAIVFLPLGLAYFMLAPFPWEITSILQAVTLPETLIWYALVPLGLWGAVLAVRHDARSFTVPVAVLIVVTFAYALVEGNVGTAYRHRAQVLPVVFVFIALGVRDAYAIMVARRASRARRKDRAASTLPGRSRPRRTHPA
jgi:hypothetical protein